MAQRWVTSRGLDGLPTDRQAMLDAVWFNMWRARLRPYRELGAGDTVFFYDPSSRRVRWQTRVSRVFTDTYESKTAAARVMARTFGGSQAGFTGSAYFQQALPAGHLLARTNDEVVPVDLAKPEGVRFPQQGWLRVDDLPEDVRVRWGFDPPPQGPWAGGLPDARSLLGQLVGQLLRTLHGRLNRMIDIGEDDRHRGDPAVPGGTGRPHCRCTTCAGAAGA